VAASQFTMTITIIAVLIETLKLQINSMKQRQIIYQAVNKFYAIAVVTESRSITGRNNASRLRNLSYNLDPNIEYSQASSDHTANRMANNRIN
jgi:hypothetical protein